MGLLETAAATLIGGERRIEISSRNVTNVNSPGFKREIAFTELLADRAAQVDRPDVRPHTDVFRLATQGALIESGSPWDIAIDGPGMLLVRSGDNYQLSRGGQFAISADGLVTDVLGRVLQQATGGDLVVSTANPEILPDGTILDDGVPVGAIGLYQGDAGADGVAIDPARLPELAEDGTSELRQGMLESSNVVLSDELIGLMRAQRQVESGAQLVRAYDRLMGQALSTFGRTGG